MANLNLKSISFFLLTLYNKIPICLLNARHDRVQFSRPVSTQYTVQGVPKKGKTTGCPKEGENYRVSQRRGKLQGVPKKGKTTGCPKEGENYRVSQRRGKLQGVPKKPKTIEITYCKNLNALTLS